MTGARIVDGLELVLALGMALVWVWLILGERAAIAGKRPPRPAHPRLELLRLRLLVLTLLALISTLVVRSFADFLGGVDLARGAVTYGAFVRGVVLIVGVALYTTRGDDR